MTDQPAFQAEVFQNEYLPADSTVVDAVVTVTASGSGPSGAAPTVAQVIMIDCSGSMANPSTRMSEAKRATAAAIDALPDGVDFAVVSGRAYADMAYPEQRQLVTASARTRAAAKKAVAQLTASGGTAMGRWLELARTLFAGSAAELKHAILLTDGRNQHETPEELAAVLSACEGQFLCDSRGVGADWSGAELRMIASALLGTADGLPDPEDLVDDFRSMTEAAMGKSYAQVSLRLWTPAGSTIRFVKQAFPHVEDLTARRHEVSARIGEYPLGAWGAESRDYHLCVEVPAGAVGEEILAARVSLVLGDQTLSQGLVRAVWTDDTALSTRINPRVAHYTGQAELAEAIQEGLAARDAGDVDTATSKLGRAVQLAEESGHTDTAKLLARVVDVVDARTGTVRLKQKVAGVDAELANVRSVKTIRVKNT
ncbi:MAG TPA: VWA domain-containing protein [Micromonosporaceae bacterium]|nr:VWA domain-containing protein [Micromonosporaceae bacterium]